MTYGWTHARCLCLAAGAALVLQGCASEKEKHQNAGDLGLPGLTVYDVSPGHLTSMVKADTKIRFTGSGGLTDGEAFKRMTSATTVTTWPGKKPVAGTWSANGLEFKPSAPLANGDYLVRVKPDGLNLAVRREYTLFHVGPMPRVAWISVGPTSITPGKPIIYDEIAIAMSEPTDASKWALTVETQQSGTFKALNTVNTVTGGLGSSFKLAAPIDISVPLRVTLGTEVGAASGLKLDGKYTGTAGSGPFTATFVPKDHVDAESLHYVPEITY